MRRLVNARFVKPIDEELLRSFADTYELVVNTRGKCKKTALWRARPAFAEEEDLPFGVEIIALPDPLYSARKCIIPDETGGLYAGRYLRQN